MKARIILIIGGALYICAGLAAVAAFIVLAVNGQRVWKWIPALLFAVWLVWAGAVWLREAFRRDGGSGKE